MYDDQTIANQSQQQGINITTALNYLALYCLICGIVAAIVAKHNSRSVVLGFLAGAFMGPIGIAAHMIMGESETMYKRK
jgi:uncharacterized integral membrane protein